MSLFGESLEPLDLSEARRAMMAIPHSDGRMQIVSKRSLSLENPATPLSAPADWLFETLSGGFGIDGQLHVNEHTALQLNTVRACVRAIGEDVGTVPLHLYRKKGERMELADDRNEYWLLHRQPNPNMTACIFREVMTANCLLWGNAFAEIEYNGAGKITALWPVHPAFVKLELLQGKEKKLRYVLTDPTHGTPNRVIIADDMLHLKGTSLDGYMGLYTIRHHRVIVGLGLALENYGLYYFMNGSRPGGVLEMAGTMSLDAQQRIRESWQHVFGGPKNANHVAILEQGMKFNPVSISNHDGQYIDSRKLQADEIARMFRVPPHVIGILERATFSNIEHQSLDYVKSCLRPWFSRWEEELNCKIFPSQREYRFEHDEDGLLRGDFATRMEGYAKGRQWGWLSVNDIRYRENLNPIGPEGDVYLQPLNMIDAAAAGEAAPSKSDGKNDAKESKAPEVSTGAPPTEDTPSREKTLTEPELRALLLPLFSDAIRRAVRCDRNKQAQRYVSQTFTPVLITMARLTGAQAGAENAARSYADRIHLRLSEWDSKTTPQIVDEEFGLALEAMTLAEHLQPEPVPAEEINHAIQ